MTLADRVLAAFDEFLESKVWKDAEANFRENGFKLKMKKTILGREIIREFNIAKLVPGGLSPQLLDRVILEVKDALYSYAERNPEKATDFIRQIVAKLNSILDG